ncbi:MAG: class I mannose-6-phosphate isomerase [Flavobacteriaceae bacterium]|nr:class I mannose-6-phosphate isomerase [Flavobacteriaceae bacterium]
MKFDIYPLQFDPILKERIWGGEKLKTELNKPITSNITGESWEISTVEGDVSVISNGTFKGISLNELIDNFPTEVLGTKVFNHFGKQFPLLFKYLDAKTDLSIQVHPNDELAEKRHNSFGKTEMWYIMQADEGSRIIVGFKNNSNSKEYISHLENNTLIDILDEVKVKTGDVFFLETGTVHAIGAGLLVAEIQQTSDITYRIYDFDRIDSEGKKRELHIDLALDAINYNKVETKKKYRNEVNISNEIVSCTYFTTNYLNLSGDLKVSKSASSFTVYMCTEGNFQIEYQHYIFQYSKGDTILIPASMTDFTLSGNAIVLEIYIT